MNLFFRCRCDQLMDSLLCLSHKRELDALELQRGLEIERLRRERRVLRRRVACLEEAQRTSERQIEMAMELNDHTRLQLEQLLQERNPDDEFVTV